MKDDRLVVIIEGPSGVGKSTIINKIIEWLKNLLS